MRCDQVGEVARLERGALGVLVGAVGLAALTACTTAPAWAQYEINRYTVDGGGAMQIVGGVYTLGGTIGQTDAGLLRGGVYSVGGGFWAGGIGVVGVEKDDDLSDLPLMFQLHAATPNPLVRHSVIAFDLPHARFVRVRLYDAAGRLVRTLVEGAFPAGRHQRVWNGTDEGGRPVAAGIYLVGVDAATDRARQKIIVLR